MAAHDGLDGAAVGVVLDGVLGRVRASEEADVLGVVPALPSSPGVPTIPQSAEDRSAHTGGGGGTKLFEHEANALSLPVGCKMSERRVGWQVWAGVVVKLPAPDFMAYAVDSVWVVMVSDHSVRDFLDGWVRLRAEIDVSICVVLDLSLPLAYVIDVLVVVLDVGDGVACRDSWC